MRVFFACSARAKRRALACSRKQCAQSCAVTAQHASVHKSAVLDHSDHLDLHLASVSASLQPMLYHELCFLELTKIQCATNSCSTIVTILFVISHLCNLALAVCH